MHLVSSFKKPFPGAPKIITFAIRYLLQQLTGANMVRCKVLAAVFAGKARGV